MNHNKQNSAPPQADSVQTNRAAHFLAAFERIVAFICRQMVRSGIGANTGTATFRRAYLRATRALLEERGVEPSVARLAISSGLSRAEVERFEGAFVPAADLTESKYESLTAVLSTWWMSTRFTLITGEPIELPFDTAARGYERGRPTFTELVQGTAPDLDPATALAEFERVNTVSFNESTGGVTVKRRAFIPETFDPNHSDRFGHRVANYLGTLDTNYQKPGPGLGFFERDVHADYPLSPEDEARVDAFIRDKGQKLLEETDAFMRTLAPAPENGRRAGVELFFFVDKDKGDWSTGGSNNRHSYVEGGQIANQAGVTDASNVIDTLATPERDTYEEIDTLANFKPRGKT